MFFADLIRCFCIIHFQGFYSEIFSLVCFTDTDLSCNRAMLMAKRKTIIYLGIINYWY